MKSPHIAVVGSANVDLTTFIDRLPAPGETLFGRDFEMGFGGKGANQAIAARLCGAEVTMVAKIGDDLFGPATLENFRTRGIDVRHVTVAPGQPSGAAPIFVDAAGQNRIIVIKGANDDLSPGDVEEAATSLERADCLILQLEIPLETVEFTLRWASKRGIRTLLNPAPAAQLDWEAASLADYFIPNESEAEALSGLSVADPQQAAVCARHFVERGMRQVVITLGREGAVRANAGGETSHIAAYPVEAVDTTGAGDAFIGALAVFLCEGLPRNEAISRACLYAGLSTTGKGTQKSYWTRSDFERARQSNSR